jgi:hypothetical protein
MRFIDYKNEEVVIGDRVAYSNLYGDVCIGYVKNIKRGKQRTFIYIEDVYSDVKDHMVTDRLDAEISMNEILLFRVVKI